MRGTGGCNRSLLGRCSVVLIGVCRSQIGTRGCDCTLGSVCAEFEGILPTYCYN